MNFVSIVPTFALVVVGSVVPVPVGLVASKVVEKINHRMQCHSCILWLPCLHA